MALSSGRVEDLTARPRAFSLACVVPVFNEEAGIRTFLSALAQALSAITADYEMIVVNDGSTDRSASEILGAAETMRLHYLEFSRNFGKEQAIQAGLDAADSDCVVVIDADFQHPPQLIASMVERWKHGTDMIYAVKARRRAESPLRRMAAAAFYGLVNSDHQVLIPPDAGDFRLLDRKVVEALRALPERNRFMKGLYAWVGFKSEAIEFVPAERENGQSKFDVTRLMALASTGLTSFSIAPLRCVSIGGMILSTLAFIGGCYLVAEKLFFGQSIPGFATIGASIFFFAGLQLLGIGIVGEYVGRIFQEVKQRPGYIIARTLQSHALDARLPVSFIERRAGV